MPAALSNNNRVLSGSRQQKKSSYQPVKDRKRRGVTRARYQGPTLYTPTALSTTAGSCQGVNDRRRVLISQSRTEEEEVLPGRGTRAPRCTCPQPSHGRTRHALPTPQAAQRWNSGFPGTVWTSAALPMCCTPATQQRSLYQYIISFICSFNDSSHSLMHSFTCSFITVSFCTVQHAKSQFGSQHINSSVQCVCNIA